jgi:hypothetical protein
VDSNPFGILRVGNKSLVTDAGANALTAVDSSGDVGTVSVFPNRLVNFQGQKVPMQAVPNTVVKGPDGPYYVGQLTGFPFPVGGARVYRVVPGDSRRSMPGASPTSSTSPSGPVEASTCSRSRTTASSPTPPRGR